MSNKNLWIASASGAVFSLLVSNLPIINLINCLLCAGFWGSAIFAVWLYRRLSGGVTPRQGTKVGLLSGSLAGVIGFLLSFVGLAGIQGIMRGGQQFLPGDAFNGIQDIPAWGAILINLIGIILEIGMGALGGWIGGMLFQAKRKPEVSTDQASHS